MSAEERKDEFILNKIITRPAQLPDILTKQQVAEYLMVSTKQVQTWIAEKKLHATRLGHKTLRIRRKDLERFLDRNGTS